MPSKDDLDLETTASDKSEQKTTDADEPSSVAEWKNRFNGANRIAEQRRKALEKLQDEYDTTISTYETKLTEASKRLRPVEDLNKEHTKAVTDLTRERDTLQSQLTAITEAAAVQKDFPNLTSDVLVGINKGAFKDDVAYKAYLKTLNDKFGPATPATPPPPANAPDADVQPVSVREVNFLDRLAGMLPNSPPNSSTSHAPGGKRTANQISAELSKLRPTDPAYETLMVELDAALG